MQVRDGGAGNSASLPVSSLFEDSVGNVEFCRNCVGMDEDVKRVVSGFLFCPIWLSKEGSVFVRETVSGQ